MRKGLLTWLVVKYTDIREHHHLRIFGRLLHDPYLFHLNERSVPGAFAVGLFCAWIPIPLQMILAAALAIAFRVNVPLSVVLVWLTNPFTIPPMFYFAYTVGTWFTGETIQAFEFQPTMEWLEQEFHAIGEPFLLGCLILAISSSLIGYLSTRLFWNERLSRLLHLRVERHRRSRRYLLLKNKTGSNQGTKSQGKP